MSKEKPEIIWPALPYKKWKDTLEALHMKMQIAGKLKLELTPFLNHWWNVAFYVTSSGMTTGPIPYLHIIFELNFDFINHELQIHSSDGKQNTIPLAGCSVAEFYNELMDALNSIGIKVTINKMPSEVPNPIPCDIDERSAYNKEHVLSWWKIILNSWVIFEKFRAEFRGKSSPVHFFWGSFDLCLSHFCGKLCLPPESGGSIMRFAENEENITFGFWAGNQNYPQPAFYSYIYPAPKGIEAVKLNPVAANFNSALGEFILNYDDVRNSTAPEDAFMSFLRSAYTESAKLAGWDVEALRQITP